MIKTIKFILINFVDFVNEYSNVWKCYKRDGDKATCLICMKVLACKGSCTSGIHRHLQNIHNMKRTNQTPKLDESLLLNPFDMSTDKN